MIKNNHFNHVDRFRDAFIAACITLVLEAYSESLKVQSIKNNWKENDITLKLNDHFDSCATKYLRQISTNVEDYQIVDDQTFRGYSYKTNRIDLRFVCWSSNVEHKYYMEAKRITEKDSDLKRRYITDGIDSYLTNKYKAGFLAGYLVEGSEEKAVEGINNLLKKDKRLKECLRKKQFPQCNTYYESYHNHNRLIRHIILDFTNCK